MPNKPSKNTNDLTALLDAGRRQPRVEPGAPNVTTRTPAPPLRKSADSDEDQAVQLQVWVSQYQRRQLKTIAASNDTTLSAIFRHLADQYIAEHS